MSAVPKEVPPEFKRDVVRVHAGGDLSRAEAAADLDTSGADAPLGVHQPTLTEASLTGQTSVLTGRHPVNRLADRRPSFPPRRPVTP